MTEREKAMQFAQKQGYDSYPYGTVPVLYKDAPHLKQAWEAGYKERQAEYADGYY